MNERDQQRWDRVIEAMDDPRRRVVAFVGSGLSKAPPALVPDWVGLFEALCDECEELGKGKEVDDLRTAVAGVPGQPGFLVASFDALHELMGPTHFERAVSELLTPRGDGIPEATRILVRRAFSGIITTNLDYLIEDAWAEAAGEGLQRPLRGTWTGFDGRGQIGMANGTDWLWKIHGTLSRSETWVLTTDRYAETIYANEAHREALRTVVQTAMIVFVGFGGTDLDLDRILGSLTQVFGAQGQQHILLTREVTSELRSQLGERSIMPIAYGGPEDHSELAQRLAELPPAKISAAPATAGDGGERAYRDWVGRETSHIDIRGVSSRGASREATRFPIEELYTELHVIVPGLGAYSEANVALTELAADREQLVVEGDPGAGKTTFLRRLARTYLAGEEGRLPVPVNIADFELATRDRGALLAPRHLTEFAVATAREHGVDVTVETIEEKAVAGRCAWLLDGFDLIDHPSDRQRITRLVNSITGEYPGSRVVLVSRPQAIVDEVFTAQFERVTIAPLDDDRRYEFISAWSRLLFGKDQAGAHTQLLWDAIRDSSALRRLATNSMMLTCMAVIHYNDRRLPAARADLLDAVLRWLLDARQAGADDVPTQQAILIYRDLALAMQDREEGVRERMDRGEAAMAIASWFEGDVERAESFLRAEEERRGILVTRGEEIRFWHLWFQEYLAAACVAGRRDEGEDGWVSVLRSPRFDANAWKETLAFVPLCLFRLGLDRVDLFLEVLSERSSGALAERARAIALGGRVLIDLQASGVTHEAPSGWLSLLEDVGPIFASAAGEVPLSDRLGTALAWAFADPRAESAELEWVPIPGGEMLFGAQADDPESDCYDEWATAWEGPVVGRVLTEFEISANPVTVAQFQGFVDDGGYEDDRWWSAAGWEWRLEDGYTAPSHWGEQVYEPTCPVTWVSYYEAEAFAGWIGYRSETSCEVPSEEQWERAATFGTAPGSRFPWGNELSPGEDAEANWARCGLRRKTPVGLFPRSNTAAGVTDMFGNVEEWCRGGWAPQHDDGRSSVTPLPEFRPARGGSALRYSRLCRPTYRSRLTAMLRYESVGFRVVRTPPSAVSTAVG